ncbi:hypothetical protein [Myxococcus qinghaiensis]|uniref:hypothetical protein n=1 Tax=Myxococcus qinghaiensis TaxID=2906758 RepID=UPI0020A7F02B|nr:hypothetical protein [Myxococcus qinghaiensis]MCP3163992.1 hypothetical protein [Myxococcus qinghaiensis]
MARDCLQPWMDRLAHAQLEAAALERPSPFGGDTWGEQWLDARMLNALRSNPDSRVLPSRPSWQVVVDPGWEAEDFESGVASY